MKNALTEALLGFAEEEVPVGALIIDPYGNILHQAHNQVERLNDPTAHAEILAIRGACEKIKSPFLMDCVLLTTLEPCKMCAGGILQARIAGVVFGAFDNQAGAVSSMMETFTLSQNTEKVWHMGGILSQECAELLAKFFSDRRH